MERPIASCGLYCGACRKYLKGKCPGCRLNERAAWCAIRTCCIEHGWQSCADCTLAPLAACRRFNNLPGKIFGMLFGSDRSGCIARIREVGAEAFAAEMELAGRMNRPVTKK
ncbi:DUF3795 domain-containing protein [Alistipes sp.]|uniref:DUF3795 domain-containing protein n=1 Tax=Alistipes sp. TaxID=1872444 RepID=UPI003AF03232